MKGQQHPVTPPSTPARCRYGTEVAAGNVPAAPLFAFQLLNAVGDLFQIIPAVEKAARPDWGNMTREQARAALRCASGVTAG